MQSVTFALQFTGQASPVAPAAGVLKAAMSAPSAVIRSEIGAKGVRGGWDKISGGVARFESVVTVVGEGRFIESGEIKYGDGASVSFVTKGEGAIGKNPHGVMTGAVVWAITGGTGAFDGASGYITSNFIVSDKGEVTDNQMALIYLKG
jgi:hypothetical protein